MDMSMIMKFFLFFKNKRKYGIATFSLYNIILSQNITKIIALKVLHKYNIDMYDTFRIGIFSRVLKKNYGKKTYTKCVIKGSAYTE